MVVLIGASLVVERVCWESPTNFEYISSSLLSMKNYSVPSRTMPARPVYQGAPSDWKGVTAKNSVGRIDRSQSAYSSEILLGQRLIRFLA